MVITCDYCVVKSLCERQRDVPTGLGSTTVQCETDGSFKPMQCDARNAKCWCVDGLGNEVEGSQTTVYIDEHKPSCGMK